MDVLGWWRRRNAGDQVEVKPTASEVDAEYAEYMGRIRKAMVFGAIVGILSVAFLFFYAWLSSFEVTGRRSNSLHVSSPQIVLDPLPSSLTLAGFSLLAAVAIALQLAVRTPSEAEARPATALARRRFLCFVAGLVVPATFALAAYAVIPVLSTAPSHFDIVRLFGTALCSILVALIAADAGVASDPDFAPAEKGRVWRARAARRALIGLRVVGDNPAPVPPWTIVWQALVLVGAPCLLALASSLSAPEMPLRQTVVLVILAVALALITYAIAIRVYVNAVMRDWTSVAFIITLTTILGALCWLMFVSMTLQRLADVRSLTLALKTVAWAIAYVALPAFLAARSLAPNRDRSPRLLGLLVKGVLVGRLRRRHRGVEPSSAPAYNRLALVAPWLSVFLPFGLVLGVIAKQQIRRAQHATGQAPQRGIWVANLAIGLTVFFVVVLIGGALIIAAIDPPEWDAFIWG